MKPLNLNTTGCDPISSNCVIWQGPDIPCIHLCKGDTVSDVVFKLATELCEVLDIFDVSTYDLPSACFNNQACNPSDFHALIQLIIYKICCLESDDEVSCENASGTARVSSSSERLLTDSTCPDCYVTIAECFRYTNEFGDLVESMKLDDYARTIGNKVCDLVNQINNLNAAVSDLDLRVTALENTPAPIVTLPTVTPVCVISPAVPVNMNIVLSALEQQFCSLVSVTGSPNNISSAIAKQCIGLNGSDALGPYGGTMAALSGWITTANTLAASMNNMWLTICDLRAAVQNIKENCCPSGCDGVEISLTAVLSGTELRIFLNGTLPPGFSDCAPAGNIFKVTDGYGAYVNTPISVATYINDPIGFALNIGVTPLNILTNITITSDVCVTDGTSTCQLCINYTVTNISTCPSVTIIPDVVTGTSVTVLYTPLYVPGNYTTEIWSSDFTTLVASVTQYLTTANPVTQIIPGLTPGTNYQLRLVIDAAGNISECPYSTFATNPALCLPPSAVAAAVQIPVDCPMCGPAIDFVSNPTVDGVYVDDTSQYLLIRSGGTFNDIFNDNYTAAMTGVPSPATVSIRNSVTTPDGKTYISYNDNSAASASIIYRYDNTGTLQNTITLPFSGATSLRCNNMVYSEFDGKVYFMSWANGTLGTTTKLCMLDPATDTVTSTFTAINAAIAGVFPNVFANPVNGVLYLSTNVVTLIVVNPATDTVITTLADAGYVQFNKDNGDFWVMRNTQNTINVYDINNVLLGVATAPVGLLSATGSANGIVYPLTYYPGDGTIGSERMFGMFNNGVLTGNIVEFEVSGGFTSNVFASIPYTTSPMNIRYSYAFNKLFFTYGTTLEAYAPTDGTTTYASITVGGTNLMWPWEDTTNQQMVYFNFSTAPTSNIFWIGLDTTNAIFCTEGIVDMYLGNQGPFIYNEGTLSWDAMVTASAAYSTPGAGQFTLTGTFGSASVVTAALLVSTDYGFTYVPYADASGNLYANVATWAAGRVYANPGLTWQMKIVFTTTDNCSLQSSLI